MITLTLNQIKKHDPCEDGWRKLLKSLGGIRKYGKDTPVTFEQIINSNGLDDAFWALRVLGPEHQPLLRHYAVDCAESVKHLMEDERSLKSLKVARLHADGKASDNELAAANDAAWDATRDAAWSATWDDAWAAAGSAAWDASWAAAWDVTRAAAWDSFAELLIEYTRTGKRVMNAQEIIKKHIEKALEDK